MCVRMYVRTYVCMYVCTYARTYVCMYVCMYVRMYVRMYVCMCMYLCIYVCTYVRIPSCTHYAPSGCISDGVSQHNNSVPSDKDIRTTRILTRGGRVWASALLLVVNFCPASMKNLSNFSTPISVTRYLFRGAPQIRDEFQPL